MKMKSYLLLVFIGGAGLFPANAVTIFSDDFSEAGSLNGSAADLGGSWSVSSGNLSISGGEVDTANSNSGSVDLAFASFSRPLTDGETMLLTLNTVESSGSFATVGWAGISLYENGNERVFMGSPGNPTVEWGIAGSLIGSIQTFSPPITAESQTATFEYVFDTGAWTFVVNAQQLSGTVSAGMAFDQIRIGSDVRNIADIAVSDITVAAVPVPEPASALQVMVGGLGAFLMRRIRASC